MLAIAPELVGPDRRDRPVDPNEKLPLEQRDLTMFGTGHLSPSGAIGFPSKADLKTGQASIASIRKNLLPYVRNRIERLRQNPTY